MLAGKQRDFGHRVSLHSSQAGAAPKIIAALAVFAGLFHPMHHRFAAFFADLARGLGKRHHFAEKPVTGRSYDRAGMTGQKFQPFSHLVFDTRFQAC